MTKRLIAKIEPGPFPKGAREIHMQLQGEAAAITDKLNARLDTTDSELAVICWTLGTASIEAALDGKAYDIEPLAVASYIRDQLRGKGRLEIEETT